VELVERKQFLNFREKPRKQGGGKGNVGNLKDEENKDKYVKEGEENKAEEEEPQP